MTDKNKDKELLEHEEDTQDPILHQNEYYDVLPYQFSEDAPFMDGRALYLWGYVVRNRETGVLEHQCVALPEAMHVSEQLNSAMIKQSWNWRKQVVEAAPTEPEGTAH